ncbi:hypothetical protein LQV63_30780 [Paenibacillus profundus]|uniref:Uncharacterized protein n=1 Tax=Paenibacillus profundus TaxID=1173085 RepID=A0ABS8YTA2_9BACL|nr:MULTISPECIES: hypothetical protein [Paenibacillus]MCE5173616.1 hypothetical protein [Paenibacillus profundus]
MVQTELGRFATNDERQRIAIGSLPSSLPIGGRGWTCLCSAERFIYSVLRLFVTSGNAPEKLYSNLGFLSGDELTDMICSMPRLNDSRG